MKSWNLEQANKAIKHGVIAGCFVGVVTTLIVALAIATGASGSAGDLGYWNDPWMIVDIVLIFALTFGMYRKSRLAAVVMVLYFIISKVAISLESGAYTGGIVSLIILYYFGRAALGTFAFHRIEKAENPDYKGPGKLFYFITIPGSIVLILVLLFGILVSSDVVPNTCVVPGEDVPEAVVEQLIAENVIYPEESILYYYSWGIFSHLDGGSVLTDNYIVTYEKDENDVIQVYELPIAEISRIETLSPGSPLEDGVHRIYGASEEEWMIIQLSVESAGDQLFLAELNNRMAQ